MRLVVQIPCYNEEAMIAKVIADIPRSIPGIREVLVLVVDDGSTDQTVSVALAAGADCIAHHVRNRGLAAAFRTGVDAALRLGADIIVNTDGDNQYSGADIPKLVQPILRGRADLVVGDRDPSSARHFSAQKRFLQAFGSWVVRQLSGTTVPDAPSGFRALSREAALRLNVVTSYSYTLETLIQAGSQRLAVSSVPISANPTARQSRLARSTLDYVQRSLVTLVRAYAMYQPVRVFATISLLLFVPGLLGVARFLWYDVHGVGSGHVQSLVLSGVLLVIGLQVGLIGLVADLIAGHRRLMEEALYRLRKLDVVERPLTTPRSYSPEPPPDETSESITHV
ncbi:MAG TPA: glycosyltransferase family 2 protein [Chloroflexota bacterium]|nr:glycosyltransferase family 2 protein [Chloroflexota bacterium]